MAIIVSFGNMKGGVGKSSLTLVAANYISKMKNKSVLILDADDLQHTAASKRKSDINNSSTEKNDLYHIVEISSLNAKQYIVNNYDDFDYIFIDLPGNLKQPGVKNCYSLVDYIFIPTSLSDDDMDSTIRFYSFLHEEIIPVRKENNFNTSIYGVISMEKTNSKEYKYFKDEIERECPLKFLDNVYPFSNIIRRNSNTIENKKYISKSGNLGDLSIEIFDKMNE